MNKLMILALLGLGAVGSSIVSYANRTETQQTANLELSSMLQIVRVDPDAAGVNIRQVVGKCINVNGRTELPAFYTEYMAETTMVKIDYFVRNDVKDPNSELAQQIIKVVDDAYLEMARQMDRRIAKEGPHINQRFVNLNNKLQKNKSFLIECVGQKYAGLELK